MREKVLGLQGSADEAILDAVRATGVPVLEMPTGLTVDERVRWTVNTAEPLGLLTL
ncbi:hypothetical protein [Streptomyces sp. NPDC002067]